MKAFNSLGRLAPKILRQLVKSFGVSIIVYKPLSLDTVYGGKGSNIEYDPEPIVDGMFLIPSLIKSRDSGSEAMIDPFLDDPQTLYTDATILIPNYSKVEVLIKDKAPMLFKVELPKITKDDNDSFLRKYPLVPISDMVSHSFEDISITEIIEFENEIQEETQEIVETVSENTGKAKYTYSPIKE